jgi:oligopeptide transport system substrate-binding protein
MWGLHPSRPLRATALGACAVVLALACGQNGGGATSTEAAPTDQQVLRVNDQTEPNSYDPGQQTYTYEAAVGRLVFEPLLKPKADLSDVEGAGAQSFDVSSDGLTYTFHLRSGAKWSDGKPVTAQDWVYGWKRLLNPALAAGYVGGFFDQTVAGAAKYGDVDQTNQSAVDSFLNGLGLSAPDDHTFVIKLQDRAPYFKWIASLWVATPIRKDIVEQAAGGAFPSTDATKAEMWANDAKTIVGNGMFKISEIQAKDHATLVPNTSYWGGAPKLQKLIEYFITDANTAFAKYRTGDLDILSLSTDNVDVVKNDAVLKKQSALNKKLSTFWMVFNTQETPWDNEKLRMAFAKAIDRDKLANDVLHGTVSPFQTFIPKGMPGYDASLGDSQKFDPTAAKKLLQDSGVSPASLSKFKLLTRDSTANKTTNQFLVDQWKTNLGVDIPLDVIDSKTVTSHLRKGQFDIYGPDGWGADYPDQQDWFGIFFKANCHSLNWGCVSLPGYEDLVNKANANGNASDRQGQYKQAQTQLVNSAAVAFIYQEAEFDVIKPYVSGLQITPIDDQRLPGDLYYHDVFIAKH